MQRFLARDSVCVVAEPHITTALPAGPASLNDAVKRIERLAQLKRMAC